MQKRRENAGHGFTLLELIVSMAVGLIVMAAMASLFRTGMTSTFIVAQRAETQQNMRAAIDIMTKDISMAGAGLPSGGLQLPMGGTGSSKYGCDQSGTCYVPAYLYPNANYMYGILPGYKNGVQGNAAILSAPGQINDSITVIYVDYNFPLWQYNLNFTTASNANVTVIAGDTPPAINSAGGILQGDLILINGGGTTEVGEVTNLTTTNMTFANLDPLNINQSGATSNNLNKFVGAGSVSAYRLYAVTYYLSVPAAVGQLPRLMRQVNGLTPVPVADNIINLQFGYDTYDSLGNLQPNVADVLGTGLSPNLIQKINIVVMGESPTKDGNKSQNMYLATSISARNMAFRNRYQ